VVRTANLAKNFIVIAPAAYLDQTLIELDRLLATHTPCVDMPQEELVRSIARIHADLVLAHPFREGNGRLSRWVADLMALLAGYPPLAWVFDKDLEVRQRRYFDALRHRIGDANARRGRSARG